MSQFIYFNEELEGIGGPRRIMYFLLEAPSLMCMMRGRGFQPVNDSRQQAHYADDMTDLKPVGHFLLGIVVERPALFAKGEAASFLSNSS